MTNDVNNRTTVIVLLFALLLALIVVGFTFVAPVHAHSLEQLHADFPDQPNPMGEWLHGLKSKRAGGPCCNGFDGKPPQAWVRTFGDPAYGSHYQVMIEHQWIDVPEDAVIAEPNKYGAAVVWYSKTGSPEGARINIKCFLPGELY